FIASVGSRRLLTGKTELSRNMSIDTLAIRTSKERRKRCRFYANVSSPGNSAGLSRIGESNQAKRHPSRFGQGDGHTGTIYSLRDNCSSWAYYPRRWAKRIATRSA